MLNVLLDDVLGVILGKLPKRDRYKLACVCQQWLKHIQPTGALCYVSKIDLRTVPVIPESKAIAFGQIVDWLEQRAHSVSFLEIIIHPSEPAFTEQVVDKAASILEHQDLTKLILSGEGRLRAPKQLSRLSKLKSLTLKVDETNGKIDAWVRGLDSLKQLEYLAYCERVLDIDPASTLKDKFGHLEKLETLKTYDKSQMNILPAVPSLTTVKIMDPPADLKKRVTGAWARFSVPQKAKFASLERDSLEHLDMARCNLLEFLRKGLRQIPNRDTDCSFAKLKTLNLAENKLHGLPSLLGMTSLVQLDISQNRFKKLPASLQDVPQLTYLNISPRYELQLDETDDKSLANEGEKKGLYKLISCDLRHLRILQAWESRHYRWSEESEEELSKIVEAQDLQLGPFRTRAARLCINDRDYEDRLHEKTNANNEGGS